MVHFVHTPGDRALKTVIGQGKERMYLVVYTDNDGNTHVAIDNKDENTYERMMRILGNPD